MKALLLFLSISFCHPSIGVANAETIRWVTESWKNYTNKDGSGLYHDIVQAVFAEHQLAIVYMPWKRALLKVKNGKADMAGATSFVEGYTRPDIAILATPISILFHKDNMNFSTIASLQNHVAVWASPYEDELFSSANRPFIKGFSVQEREIAYKLLLSGRADYFLDAKSLHQAWLQRLAVRSKGKLQASDYQLVDIEQLQLYMIFTKNKRGQRLKEIFEQGMSKLIQNDQLGKIYEKYHFLEQMPMPSR